MLAGLKKSVFLLMIFCAISLSSCGNSEYASTIYVLTPREKAVQFTNDLASIVVRHGLEPNQGRSVDDHGRTYWVTEARGRWVRLWSTNVPLSGEENVALCGSYSEGHPDPGQYIVTIDRRFPGFAQDTPSSLLQKIAKELKSIGYEVRETPIECSSLSRIGSKLN